MMLVMIRIDTSHCSTNTLRSACQSPSPDSVQQRRLHSNDHSVPPPDSLPSPYAPPLLRYLQLLSLRIDRHS